jgi:hypothetical protein
MGRRVAASLVVIVGACRPLSPAVEGADGGLAGPRTLGFIELRGRIPTPAPSGGSLAPSDGTREERGGRSAIEDGIDAGDAAELGAGPESADAGDGGDLNIGTLNRDASSLFVAWRVESLSRADARALDARGRRFALRDGAVIDEGLGARAAGTERAGTGRATLPDDDAQCELPHETLAFDPSGAGYLVHRGRVFVRAPEASGWSRTMACSNVEGAAWTLSSARGWGLLARRGRGVTPALLFTRERDGRAGWYALSAVDADVTAAALDEDGSRLVLAHGGHPVLIDVTREVGGAVLATASVPFEGVTRTRAGVVVWRADGADLDVLAADRARGPFRREQVLRERISSEAGEVLGVWALDAGGRVIVTRMGVEVRPSGAPAAREVARWPRRLPSREGVSVGWRADGRPAVVTPEAWAYAR